MITHEIFLAQCLRFLWKHSCFKTWFLEPWRQNHSGLNSANRTAQIMQRWGGRSSESASAGGMMVDAEHQPSGRGNQTEMSIDNLPHKEPMTALRWQRQPSLTQADYGSTRFLPLPNAIIVLGVRRAIHHPTPHPGPLLGCELLRMGQAPLSLNPWIIWLLIANVLLYDEVPIAQILVRTRWINNCCILYI